MYKSMLQEICHKRSWMLPEYSHTMEGQKNDRFSASVIINGFTFQTDDSFISKKQAQNEVARIACDHFTDPQPSLLTAIPKVVNGVGGSAEIPHKEGINLLVDEAAVVEKPHQVESPLPPPVQSDDLHVYKGQLQNFVQQKNIALPVYSCEREGPPHDCHFKSKVTVDGQVFESPRLFRTLKEAEQAAAKVAVSSLVTDKVQEVDFSAYKNLLLSFVRKEGFGAPVYDTSMSGASHSPSFVSTIIIDGETFEGNFEKSKKLAEMSAAKVAYTELSERKNYPVSVDVKEKIILATNDLATNDRDNISIEEPSNEIIRDEEMGEKECPDPDQAAAAAEGSKNNHVGAEFKKVYVFRRTPNLVLPVHVNLNNILPITDDTWVAVGEY